MLQKGGKSVTVYFFDFLGTMNRLLYTIQPIINIYTINLDRPLLLGPSYRVIGLHIHLL